MITKGIVERVIDPYKAVVRIPTLDNMEYSASSTPKERLREAIICSISGVANAVALGDVVFVGFEDNDLGNPIILGHLLRSAAGNSSMSLTVKDLESLSTARLPEDTLIGDISYKALKQAILYVNNMPELTPGGTINIVQSTGSSTSAVMSQKAVTDALATKQATLVSGTNIKTINGTSILGEGNVDIKGGSSVNVVQGVGTSVSDVMSQDAVTKALSVKLTKPSEGNADDFLALGVDQQPKWVTPPKTCRHFITIVVHDPNKRVDFWVDSTLNDPIENPAQILPLILRDKHNYVSDFYYPNCSGSYTDGDADSTVVIGSKFNSSFPGDIILFLSNGTSEHLAPGNLYDTVISI